MKQRWTEEELIEHFTLSSEERALLENKTVTGRIGFIVLLKCLQYTGRFPANPHDVPKSVVAYLAKQLALSAQELAEFSWQGRTIKRYQDAGLLLQSLPTNAAPFCQCLDFLFKQPGVSSDYQSGRGAQTLYRESRALLS